MLIMWKCSYAVVKPISLNALNTVLHKGNHPINIVFIVLELLCHSEI